MDGTSIKRPGDSLRVAASIEWFERSVDGDPDAKDRILAYNEDDCRATRDLLDGILRLAMRC